jgi:hypothetical protein
MMTIDEAIIHAEEIAEINENIAYNTDSENWMDIAQCEKCAKEHRQLAEWLKELKRYQWIPVSERLPIPPTFCLVTTDGSHGGVIDIALYMSDGWHKASEVIAWMPLPEPYKGGEEK